MSNKLKPCPFCGKIPEKYIFSTFDGLPPQTHTKYSHRCSDVIFDGTIHKWRKFVNRFTYLKDLEDVK